MFASTVPLLLVLTLLEIPDPRIESFTPNVGGLGTTITVVVVDPPKPRTDLHVNWILYFDGIPLEGVYAESPGFQPVFCGEKVVPNKGKLKFRLDRTIKSQASWLTLVKSTAFEREVMLQLGSDTAIDQSIRPASDHFLLKVRPTGNLWGAGIGAVALLLILIWRARTTDLLRETGSVGNTINSPYSLGMTQMAFWFFLFIVAYIYIGVVTWNFYDTISQSALILMGISGGTAFGSRVIENDKNVRNAALLNEQASLNSQISGLSALISAAAPSANNALVTDMNEKITRLGVVKSYLAAIPTPYGPSRGFWTDLIWDDVGVSLHRFQIVCWTIICGLVFVNKVLHDLVMPEFSETLLTLMGISSGTYLGFKFSFSQRS